MAARARARSPLVRPLVVLALPGMYLLYKYNQYRQQQMESARRRVTERELLHLNTKICHYNFITMHRARTGLYNMVVSGWWQPRSVCARRYSSKKGVISVVTADGGPASECCAQEFKCGIAGAGVAGQTALCCPKQAERDTVGVQAAILGAQWPAGRYLSLLLKQDTFLNKLTLFDSRTSEEVDAAKCDRASSSGVERYLSGVERYLSAPCSCADLRLVDTRCRLEAYRASAGPDQLDRCLQNSSVVVMVGSPAGAETRRARERRFALVRGYAESVRRQCPEAVLVVDVPPVDCCVPVVVQTLLEAGGRADSAQRVLGAVAVAEARASSVAARTLGLDVGMYSRVPVVGGADPHTIVPLFSNALDAFSLDEEDAMRMTREVRCACASGGGEVQATRAYALARLISSIARAQICGEAPRVSAYFHNVCPHTIHVARYLSRGVRLRWGGVAAGEVHPRMSPLERHLVAVALHELERRVRTAEEWCARAGAASIAAPAAQPQLEAATHSRLSHCGRARTSIGF